MAEQNSGEIVGIRQGRPEDAPLLAELVNYAGEGMPLYLWGRMAEPGETAWDVGRRRAGRPSGSFSYTNAHIIELDGEVAGLLMGYEVPPDPEPIPADMPAMFIPLRELENLAPDTWYVNVLAVMPKYRGRGNGSRLLGLADEISRNCSKPGMSVIVADNNTGARRLYERLGYRETARRGMVKEDWISDGQEWVLLVK